MTTWGIVPCAGAGSRMQPLACSKELLPVGCKVENGRERPRAVSEYVLERLVEAGTDRICVVISPGKVGSNDFVLQLIEWEIWLSKPQVSRLLIAGGTPAVPDNHSSD